MKLQRKLQLAVVISTVLLMVLIIFAPKGSAQLKVQLVLMLYCTTAIVVCIPVLRDPPHPFLEKEETDNEP